MPAKHASADQAGGLFIGQSWYQVLEPSTVLTPSGESTFAMHGPFMDLPAASAFSQTRPGSFITVTLVLHQAAPIARARPAAA